MERLKMQQIRDIIYRLRAGQSERSIARDMGLSRLTINKYHKFGIKFNYMDANRDIPELKEILEKLGSAIGPPKIESSVEPYREIVDEQISKGAEGAAIHRYIKEHFGYTGSYSSVKRFIKRIHPPEKKVVMRIETPSGQEAQIDFGSAGMLYDPATGKMRKAWCFVMTLSYSRHQYVEFVFNQDMRTWINCHIHAFEYFGGVPKEVVIDNLKAGVILADFRDPVLCQGYSNMAEHYGIIIHPCRPATPEHKGKVENGVHYVKRNFLSVEKFSDKDDANRRVRIWVEGHAGMREHGTTHELPLKRFKEKEQRELLPLPGKRFEIFSVKHAKVHTDCHVILDSNFYSVPYKYVGETVDAIIWENTVQLYDGINLIVTHERGRNKGERITRNEDYPYGKRIYVEYNKEYCCNRASDTGPSCFEVIENLMNEGPLDKIRSIQGIIHLIDKYGEGRVEGACRRGLYYGDHSYKRIKNILEAGVEDEPVNERKIIQKRDGHEYVRGIEEFFPGEGVIIC